MARLLLDFKTEIVQRKICKEIDHISSICVFKAKTNSFFLRNNRLTKAAIFDHFPLN